ncbi:hypothetical protein [Actinomyces israelii]|uniref:hypothetical protein n=1 Tax=Actinomyces israelii TaxID=1659 RepID=UPI000ABE4C03|nr:hypothetical protein [Actinomyces israelii]
MGLSPLTNLVVSGNRVLEAATGTRLSTFTAPDADPGASLSPVLSPLADGSVAVIFEPSFTGGTAPGTISIPAMVLGPDGSVLKDVTTSTARPDFVHRADGGKAVAVASAPAGKRRLPEAWSQDLGRPPSTTTPPAPPIAARPRAPSSSHPQRGSPRSCRRTTSPRSPAPRTP